MANKLYLPWQDPETRSWHTVAALARRNGEYEFGFTKGVARLKNIPENLFHMRTGDLYRFPALIPIFRNRLPSRGRTDFGRMAQWLDLRGDEDEFALLARFGMIAGTNSILLYPEPEIMDDRVSLTFFVHGTRHMHESAVQHSGSLKPGEELRAMLDVQNPVDPDAVALRTDGSVLLGYVPAFYARDVRTIIAEPTFAPQARVTVLKNNADAPVQLRVLCSFKSPIPEGYRPLDTEDHQPTWTDPLRGTALAPIAVSG